VAVSFAALFLSTAEVAVQGSSPPLVPPDVAVDGLMTDAEQAEPAEPSADLLRTEVLAEPGFDERPVVGGEALIAARAGAPPASKVVGRGRAVGPVAAPVAADLPDDRAAVAPQDSRNLRRLASLSAECGKLISLSGLAVRPHESLPVLLGSGRL
jgi:hypothetical protein